MSALAPRKIGFSLLAAMVLLAAGLLVAVAPSPAEALPPGGTQPHDDIYIQGDDQFNPSHGVRSGRGTKKHPFVISGWEVSNIYIRDTSAPLIIRDNVISGSLTLNWNGKNVTMVDNQIGDLRVNENIERTGAPTSGYFARNDIGVVGQLRHFDGNFTKNVVGPTGDVFGQLPFTTGDRAVNFDGFHGSRFHHNTIHGYVDVRLHGHHHGSSFNSPSHYHAMPEEEEGHHGGHHGKMKEVDHTKRWHKVVVANNKIYSTGMWALRYFDQAHSANDRTAASETNEALNLPHVHRTRVFMKNNKLVGSGLVVDIFNAEDELHKKYAKGQMHIVNNNISMTRDQLDPFRSYNGIQTTTGQHMSMTIRGNSVGWAGESTSLVDDQFSGGNAGIYMNNFDTSRIKVLNNKLSDFDYGVMASSFSEATKWWVKGLETKNVGTRIYYDDSVENHPHKG